MRFAIRRVEPTEPIEEPPTAENPWVILHCGMPRTGSTVVATMSEYLAEALGVPYHNHHCGHNFLPEGCHAKVFTVRHPAYQVSSMARVGFEKNVTHFYELFKKNREHGTRRQVVIKFEDWLPNRLDALSRHLARVLYSTEIDDFLAKRTADEFSVANQRRIIADGSGKITLDPITRCKVCYWLRDYYREFGYTPDAPEYPLKLL